MRWFVVIALLALGSACATERADTSCTTCARDTVHPPGWTNPDSDAFHGKDLERRGWDFKLCASCHGDDWKGRATAPSCLGCHANGPTACDTCHGNPPKTGAHAAHVANGLSCGQCHITPTSWDSPGHLLDDAGKPVTGPAKVTFGVLANADTMPPRRTGPPTWDASSGTCTNVYCHGGVLADPAASNNRPQWSGGPTQAACGTCHGTPPGNHAFTDCASCHRTTISAAGALSSHHIDGKIDYGDGTSSCSGCHGDAQTPAPATGAHRAHLIAGRLRGPIACNECHVVPTNVTDPGHIDSAGPAPVVFGALATTDSAAASFDRATATCTNVYCHGGGARLTAEPSPGKQTSQSWTGTAGDTIYCGACHGLPPRDSAHAPTLQLTDCATCHPQTVGPFGNILVGNGKHLNGALDFQ